MTQTVNQQLYDLGVGHQVGLQRLGSATLSAVLELLAELETELTDRIRRVGTDLSRTRLRTLLRTVAQLHQRIYDRVASQLDGDVRDLAIYEADYQERAILGALPIEVSFDVPSATQLAAAAVSRPLQGHLLSDWSQQLEAGAYRRVAGLLRQSAVEGRTTDDVVRALRGTAARGWRDGVLAISRRGAESLVRTAMNHAASAAREATYAANADLIGGVRWVSTLDNRTTPICRTRDGQVFPLNSGPRPPAHWGCRSTTVPVLKSWRALGIPVDEADAGTRASMTGQVPAAETYATWLARQSAATQDEVLGPTRGRLLRAGGLTIDRFSDAAGRQYTLPELRRRDAAAFERAGLAA